MKSRARLVLATALPLTLAGCSSFTSAKIPDVIAGVMLGAIFAGLAGYIVWKRLLKD